MLIFLLCTCSFATIQVPNWSYLSMSFNFSKCSCIQPIFCVETVRRHRWWRVHWLGKYWIHQDWRHFSKVVIIFCENFFCCHRFVVYVWFGMLHLYGYYIQKKTTQEIYSILLCILSADITPWKIYYRNCDWCFKIKLSSF